MRLRQCLPPPAALLPSVVFVVLGVLSDHSGFDLWVADRFADGVSGFPFAHRWWSEGLLHDGAQWLVRVAAAGLIVAAVVRRRSPQLRPLLYLLTCLALTTSAVGMIKHETRKACPWELTRYGGEHPYVPLGDAAVLDQRETHCFPGAHSSSAFAFFGLYFLAMIYRPSSARRVLFAVLTVGFAFAGTQWLRGAHFVSHDLWSAAIAWLVAVLALPILGPRLRRGADERSGRRVEREESPRVF